MTDEQDNEVNAKYAEREERHYCDVLAGLAMWAIIAGVGASRVDPAQTASRAYEFANAMMKERTNQHKK